MMEYTTSQCYPNLGSIVFTLGFGDFTMLDTTNPSLDFTDLQYCVHDPILGLLGSNVGSDTFTLGFGDFTMLDTINPSLNFIDLVPCA